jgi:putative ABC transport system permease protein
MLLMGVDDATLIGVPPAFLLGSLADLRRPDAIAVDRAGFLKLWPGETPALGKVLELNDRRAVVAAVIEASAPFTTTPVAYTRYSQAVGFVPSQRNQLSFILARAEPGRPPAEVAAAITEATALKAVTSTGFVLETIAYYIANTGIPVNFGTVIVLGVIVGVAVVGLTFNMFVAENLKQYAALKAIGVTNGRLVRMVLLQAGVVGATGYAIGLALAAAFFDITSKNAIDLRGFHLPWWIALGAAVLTFVVMVLATLASLRRVLVVDPAMVFRG